VTLPEGIGELVDIGPVPRRETMVESEAGDLKKIEGKVFEQHRSTLGRRRICALSVRQLHLGVSRQKTS